MGRFRGRSGRRSGLRARVRCGSVGRRGGTRASHPGAGDGPILDPDRTRVRFAPSPGAVGVTRGRAQHSAPPHPDPCPRDGTPAVAASLHHGPRPAAAPLRPRACRSRQPGLAGATRHPRPATRDPPPATRDPPIRHRPPNRLPPPRRPPTAQSPPQVPPPPTAAGRALPTTRPARPARPPPVAGHRCRWSPIAACPTSSPDPGDRRPPNLLTRLPQDPVDASGPRPASTARHCRSA